MPVVTVSIASQGKAMDSTYQVLSVEVDKQLNRVPTAQIQLIDGKVAAGEFPISDALFFEPGKEIAIKLRYEGKSDATVFKGIVIRHGLEVSSESTRLLVDLKDQAFKLTMGRKSAVYRDQSDAEVIEKLLGDAGIDVGEIASTDPTHAELVQYRASDWDFILSRADVQGLVVLTDDGQISVKDMTPSGGAKQTIKYGIDQVFGLTLETDGSDQHADFESVGWDLEKLEPTQPSQAESVSNKQGNVDADNLAQKLGASTYKLTHMVPVTTDELQAWADARMARSRLSMVRGKITIAGVADIKPLDIVELERFGERFDGDALVSGVSHRVESGLWKTEISIGLDPEWYCQRPDIAAPPSAGLLPPVSGLHIGIIDDYEDDPDEEYRIKVKLPSIDTDDGTVWARLASPEAGKERGYFFRPEPGDEVVVGFFDNDPRAPIILGAMFGSKNEPHKLVKELSEDNIDKAIITKNGTKIVFVDEDKASIYIETNDENKILLDDDKQLIELSDQHGNTITMDDNGITIQSCKDLKITAKGKVKLDAKQSITLKSGSKAKLDAPKVELA